MTITNENYVLRQATYEDLESISELELLCFPVAEAATRDSFASRLKAYGNHFLLVFKESQLIAVVDGLVTDEENLTDEMYEDTGFHNENGKWQMIFGVETHPDYQHQGVATLALTSFINAARTENRLGLVLTCKQELIGFYKTFGFVNEGVSSSTHGDVIWYQMRLRLDEGNI